MNAQGLYKYNPGQSPPEELAATFVARDEILDGVLDELRARARKKANQHFLVIGPRGIGKTNLLLMIRHAVESEEKLSKAYLPIQTSEEEYSIASLYGLFARLVEIALESRVDDALAAALQSARETDDDDNAAELLIEAFRTYLKKARRKALLLVDNIDLILGDQVTDDAQLGRLRDILMNDSFLVVVGTAATYFKEASGYDRPFYNFFRNIDLADLSPEEMTDLIRKRAEWDGNDTVLQRLDALGARMKAIHHLTGGNPRLVLMLYQLCTAKEVPEIQTIIRGLLDDITPYYKARLEQLKGQQRQVLDTFARIGHPATPSELAQHLRLPVNQVNSILKRLKDTGFVAIAPQQPRKSTLYMVSERFFRIWHQMRFTRSSRRLQFLIDFMRIWYTPEEMETEADRLLGEYTKAVHDERFTHAGKLVGYLRFMADAAPKQGLLQQIELKTIWACIENKDLETANEIIGDRMGRYSTEQKSDHLALTLLAQAYLYDAKGMVEEEIGALEDALRLWPNFDVALGLLGWAFWRFAQSKTGDERADLLKKAIREFENGLKINPDMPTALSGWGFATADLARSSSGGERGTLNRAAIKRFEAALKINPDTLTALLGWGLVLTDLARSESGDERDALFRKALRKFEAALKIDPDSHLVLNSWAVTLETISEDKAPEEQERLLGLAASKVNRACEMEGLRNVSGFETSQYAHHWIRLALLRSRIAVEQDNIDRASTIFNEALGKMADVDHTLAVRELAGFFTRLLRLMKVGVCSQFLEEMGDRDMKKELGVLEPIVKTVEYFHSGRDAEILDRLNPEIREIVEEIIRKVEQEDS